MDLYHNMKIKTKHIQYIAPICIITILFFPSITHAQNVVDLFTDPLGFFGDALGAILSGVVKPLLDSVMSFQNFFPAGVNAGWTATRDFANLFFALILLFIAIATVLNTGGLDNYTAKRMLPKFIFAALFINFSKAIVGFLIDISQIIMISLYNTFGTNLAKDILDASDYAQTASESGLDSNIIKLFTIILLVVLIFVLLWTSAIFAIRIVTLWFVIMLSPLAFVSGLIPPLSSLSKSWQNMLQQALVTGPVLMFLLYLAVTVMNSGIGPDIGGNLLENGNIIKFVLVIGLLFLANIEAMKAGQSAPPMIKNAVGVAGTVATFGLGAYVGAGGVGTGKMFGKGGELVQGGVKNTDKLAGGATRGVQVLSGGKFNPNDRYEMWKEQNKTNVEKGKAFGGGYFGALAQQTLGGQAGQKANYQKTQLRLAEEARKANKLDDNPILARALASAESEIIEKNKFEERPDKIIADIKDAIKKADLVTARALTTHLNSLGKINELFNGNGPFKDIAEDYATEADQFAAFNQKHLQANDSQYDKSFLQRNKNIAKNKSGMEGFGVNAATTIPNINSVAGQPNVPQNSPLFQKYKKGSLSSNAKTFSDNLFSTRKIDPNTNKFAFDASGNATYEFDSRAFDDFVSNRSMNELENPDTWKSMNQSLKTTIIDGLRQSGLQKNDPGNAAAAWRGIEP